MKKTIKRVITFMLAVMLFAAVVPAALADGKTVGVTIPAEVRLSGAIPPQAEVYTISMAADDPAFPMPTDAVDGVSSITIKGADKGKFGEIVFDRLGVYTYTIRQKPGKNVKCAYDKTVYSMVVTVTNNDSYTGLVATVALHLKSSDTKPEEVIFRNTYKDDGPQTGDDSALALWTAAMGVSALTMGAVLVLKKKCN